MGVARTNLGTTHPPHIRAARVDQGPPPSELDP
ncbi:MAG: hypothetical protein JWP61_999 [Friedmanniella sp.]|nr:hypothetical protein [Friedmanniella sp.]